jgi:hypothetical protein
MDPICQVLIHDWILLTLAGCVFSAAFGVLLGAVLALRAGGKP